MSAAAALLAVTWVAICALVALSWSLDRVADDGDER